LKKSGVRWIVLSGGEALMHSNLEALCKALAPLQARITLLSTGLLLARDAELISECIDDVIVSLDGSAAVHDRIRNIPRAFEKLEKGVSELRRVSPQIDIGARCVVQRENYKDLGGVVAAARDLQLNRVSFLAADVSSQAFNRPDGWGDEKVAEVDLTLTQCAELEQLLQTLFVERRADFDAGFIVESPGKLLRIAQYFRALKGDVEFPQTSCNAPWVSAVIEPDGRVRPCYFHQEYGNLNEQSFPDILNSPDAIAFRRQLDVNADPICKRCVCTLNVS
jgi:MoaA/NifB/PqqE/SkfB family radical SAM enzyme